MISSLGSKFRSVVFPTDTEEPQRRSTKRRLEIDDRDSDIEIGDVVRPKRQKTEGGFVSSLSGSFVKMAEWLVRKKTSFVDTFFHRHVPTTKTTNHSTSHTGNGGLYNSSTPAMSYQRPGIHAESSRSEMRQNDDGIDLPRRSTDSGIKTNYRRDHPHAIGDHPPASQTKLYSEPTEMRSYKPHRSHIQKNGTMKSTLQECIRWEERERYKQLLQQFTTVPIRKPPETHMPVRRKVQTTQSNSSHSRVNESVLGSSISSEFSRPIDVSASTSRRRPMPTRTYGKRESQRHTSRQKLEDVIKIDVEEDSSCSEITPLRSPSLARSVTKSPPSRRSSTTSLDFKNSSFISEDWMSDLVSRYATSVRERQRLIAEEEIKIKIYGERRKQQELGLEEQIRERMRIAEREPAVITDVVQNHVIPDEDDELEVIEDTCNEFPELTSDQENRVSSALCPSPQDQMLVDGYKLQLCRRDMVTLKGLNWLNDEVINFYMNILVERGQMDNFPKVYAFNTFFYPKLMNGGHAAVKRWTRRVDVFSHRHMIVPIHLGMHWCLATVDFTLKQINYYDSMGGSNLQCLNALKSYLCEESLEKKKVAFDLSGWKTNVVKNIPQQKNGSDCGMFACKYAEYVTRNAEITFTQEHMPYFRRRMVYEILTKKLL